MSMRPRHWSTGTPAAIIRGLDQVVRHLVDQADREEITPREFAELNGYIHAAIRKLEDSHAS